MYILSETFSTFVPAFRPDASNMQKQTKTNEPAKKQIHKQTSKATKKQTNKHRNKETPKQRNKEFKETRKASTQANKPTY